LNLQFLAHVHLLSQLFFHLQNNPEMGEGQQKKIKKRSAQNRQLLTRTTQYRSGRVGPVTHCPLTPTLAGLVIVGEGFGQSRLGVNPTHIHLQGDHG
jgi:hypothetical protein